MIRVEVKAYLEHFRFEVPIDTEDVLIETCGSDQQNDYGYRKVTYRRLPDRKPVTCTIELLGGRK